MKSISVPDQTPMARAPVNETITPSKQRPTTFPSFPPSSPSIVSPACTPPGLSSRDYAFCWLSFTSALSLVLLGLCLQQIDNCLWVVILSSSLRYNSYWTSLALIKEPLRARRYFEQLQRWPGHQRRCYPCMALESRSLCYHPWHSVVAVVQCNSRLSRPPGECLDVTTCRCELNCLRRQETGWFINTIDVEITGRRRCLTRIVEWSI